MPNKETLKQILSDGHCTFETSKLLARAGVKAQATTLTFDSNGRLGNAGWIAEIWEDAETFFPAVNLYEAILLFGHLDEIPDLQAEGEQFRASLPGLQATAATRVEALCLLYLKSQGITP